MAVKVEGRGKRINFKARGVKLASLGSFEKYRPENDALTFNRCEGILLGKNARFRSNIF